jgi:hypothetical protein
MYVFYLFRVIKKGVYLDNVNSGTRVRSSNAGMAVVGLGRDGEEGEGEGFKKVIYKIVRTHPCVIASFLLGMSFSFVSLPDDHVKDDVW